MSDSDFVVGSKRKIREGEVATNKANSEAVNQVIAGNINSFIDGDYKIIEHSFNGYFSTSSIFTGAPIYIPQTLDIVRYELSVYDSGSSGTNSVNFNIYTDSYGLVGTLFNSIPSITGANGSCLIGYDVDNSSSYKVESTSHTTAIGTLTSGSLTGGNILLPYINSFSTSARSIRLKLYAREQ